MANEKVMFIGSHVVVVVVADVVADAVVAVVAVVKKHSVSTYLRHL